MIYYVWFLIICRIIGIFHTDDSEDMPITKNHRIAYLLVLMPVFGRILGWW